MENVIFLDIDGVLKNNTDKYSSEALTVLLKLINKYNAKIVIISSLFGNGTLGRRKKLIKIFNNFGIYDIDFIDPNYECFFLNVKISGRVIGIIDYLRKNRWINYIILDDEFERKYKYLGLNYFKTNKNKGLLEKDLSKIEFKKVSKKQFEVFDSINYNYRELGDYERVTTNLLKTLKLISEKRK